MVTQVPQFDAILTCLIINQVFEEQSLIIVYRQILPDDKHKMIESTLHKWYVVEFGL